ncbi:transposase [Streptococcus equi subsp. equi]|nr:transposase [Streptococcus equi subsp. equi]
MPYSNAKLEPTNKTIKDMKEQAFGFRNFKNFKVKIPNALKHHKRRDKIYLFSCLAISHPLQLTLSQIIEPFS